MNDHHANGHHVMATAFLGSRLLASGSLSHVAEVAKAALDADDGDRILVFDDTTGRRIDLDLSGTLEEVLTRIPSMLPYLRPDPSAGRRPRGRGRPKLGVVSREVTLLPRHWAWLGTQRGGASATLRRLVDEARRRNESEDQVRQSQDAAYRFMNAMVGNAPGFEEALRALYARDTARFDQESAAWPRDVRVHARALAATALDERTVEGE